MVISAGQGVAMGDAIAVGGTLPPPPTVVSAPTLSTYAPVVGSAITPTPATWTGTPSVTAEWFYADTGAQVPGSPTTPGAAYTPVTADLGHPYSYVETATTLGGSVASAAPMAAAVVAAPPISLVGMQLLIVRSGTLYVQPLSLL